MRRTLIVHTATIMLAGLACLLTSRVKAQDEIDYVLMKKHKFGAAAGGGGPSSPTRFSGCNALEFPTPLSVSCAIANPPTGSVLVYFIVESGSTTTTYTVADNCNTGGASDSYTVLDGPTVIGTSGNAQSGWASVGLTRTSCTITVTYSSGPVSVLLTVEDVSNPAGTPIDKHAAWNAQGNPGTGANAVTSNSITTTLNGDYLLGFTADVGVDGGTLTAGTGYVLRDTNTNYPTSAEDQTQASAGAITAKFTDSATFAQHLTTIVALSSH